MVNVLVRSKGRPGKMTAIASSGEKCQLGKTVVLRVFLIVIRTHERRRNIRNLSKMKMKSFLDVWCYLSFHTVISDQGVGITTGKGVWITILISGDLTPWRHQEATSSGDGASSAVVCSFVTGARPSGYSRCGETNPRTSREEHFS